MNADNKKFKRICEKYIEANEDYRKYADQFLTTVCDGKVERKSTKVVGEKELKDMRDLRKKLERAKKEFQDFFGLNNNK